jgi:hypothetical protein
MVVLCISTVVALGLLLCYLHLMERRRKKALAGVAHRLGLKFRGDYDETLVERITRFELKPWGWFPHAENLLHGRYRGHQVQVFDYQCVQQHGKHSKTVTATFFMVYLGKSFPKFLLYPETILDKAVQAIGLEDIDFDSIEFQGRLSSSRKTKNLRMTFAMSCSSSTFLVGHIFRWKSRRNTWRLSRHRRWNRKSS